MILLTKNTVLVIKDIPILLLNKVFIIIVINYNGLLKTWFYTINIELNLFSHHTF